MPAEAIAFERFDNLKDNDCAQRIVEAKAALGKRVVILAHHYQRADVYKHAWKRKRIIWYFVACISWPRWRMSFPSRNR